MQEQKIDENKVDIGLLKQYSTVFEKEKMKNIKENEKDVIAVVNAIKKQEENLNGGETNKNSSDLLNILVYVYRYIFGKQIKSGLVKRIREIKLLLEDLIFILEKNQEKINKYITQGAQSELKISILGQEYKGKAMELEEKNQEKLYYCYYLINELEIISSIVDGLDQVTDNIFNNKLYHQKIEDVLKKISSFAFIITEKVKKEENEDKLENRKITLSNSVKRVYLTTKNKFKEFIADFKSVRGFDMSIRNVIDYMNRYIKFKKDVLELYYNKLYNKVTELDTNFVFYINNKKD